MAIIYNYPQKTTPAGGDFLVITDSEQPAPNKNRTKSLTVDNLANYIVTSTSGITGSGTLNTIAMFTPDGQSIGDSIITQAPLGQAITVNAGLDVVEDLNVTGTIETSSNLLVNGTTTLYGPLEVNSTYYDAAGDEGTDGDVLVAKGTPGNMVTRWVSKAGTGIVTGSGTTNTLPLWSDGPNGVLSDSQLQQVGPNPSGLYQMIFNNADRFIINKPSSVTSGDPEYLIQQDGNYKVSFGWDDDGSGFGYIYNWAGNGLRLGAAGQNPQLELDTVAPKIISHTDHEFEQGILDRNGFAGINGQVLTASGNKIEWSDATDVVSGAVAKLIPFNVTASPGGSSVYNADNNIVEISWTTGNGIYVLILPTATGSNAYRNIRFVTNGTFPGGASHKIEITALPGETVDGAAFFEISKTYEGVSLWSNGTEWIVIQAKAH